MRVNFRSKVFRLFVPFSRIQQLCWTLGSFEVLFSPQDFEALTPNLLARTVETVEGGGIVVILLRTMNSLKQLYTMTMVCAPLWVCSLQQLPGGDAEWGFIGLLLAVIFLPSSFLLLHSTVMGFVALGHF